jgi:hypothetical protein
VPLGIIKMPDITHYTIEQADIIVQAIANGHTTIQASHMAGICHMTAYNWRKRYPEFAERWNEAVEIATDCVESVVTCAAVSGNLNAAFYWLKHHRPRVYNREALAKLAILNAAITHQASRGGGRLTINVDADGIPQVVENPRRSVVILPSNNRESLFDQQSPDPCTEAIEPVVAEQKQFDLALEQPTKETALLAEVIVPPRPPTLVLQPDVQRWKALSE